MNAQWKILAYAFAVLVAGMAIGVMIGSHYTRRSMADGLPPSEIAQMIRSHLKDRAGLSAGQVQKIDPIIQQTASRIEAIHTDTMRQVGKTFREFHQTIAGPADLSESQKAKLTEMEKEHEARLPDARPTPIPNSTP